MNGTICVMVVVSAAAVKLACAVLRTTVASINTNRGGVHGSTTRAMAFLIQPAHCCVKSMGSGGRR